MLDKGVPRILGLKGIIAKQNSIIYQRTLDSNDFWGEYGTWNKLNLALEGLGITEGEHYADEHEGTSKPVRQIKEKAVRRLRHTSRSKKLKVYLGQ